jgi:uncharacterized membrane protein YeiB
MEHISVADERTSAALRRVEMITEGAFGRRAVGLALMAAIVELTLTTAYIHLSLGGLLFTLNAAGYAALAASLLIAAVVPLPIVERFAWLPRVALLGYTATTIVGYLLIGPYFGLGWVAKAIEVAILTLLVVDSARVYGSPAGILRAAIRSLPQGA